MSSTETALEKWEREAKARGFVEPSKTSGASTREMLIFLTTAIQKESTESKLRQRFGDTAFDEAYSKGFITRTPQPSPSKRVTSVTLKGRGWIGDQETEKEEGEVKPGTRYIKWKDFTSLHSYPLIERAVTYPHDYKRKCHPFTKDGYVSVDALYNMSAWSSWKSSSLGEGDRKIAEAINALNLYHLMKLNEGRRMNKPALFPVGLLPLR